MSKSQSRLDYCRTRFFAEIENLYASGIKYILLHRFLVWIGKRIIILPVRPDVILSPDHVSILQERESLLLRTADILREFSKCQDGESIYDFLTPWRIKETEV